MPTRTACRVIISAMKNGCVPFSFPVPSRGPDIHVTDRQMNSLLLNWTEIYSWAAHGIVVGYRIYYKPYYSNQTFTVVQTNASTFNIKLNNLREATLYAIMVTGITSKGEGLQRFLSVSTCKSSLSLSLSLSQIETAK